MNLILVLCQYIHSVLTVGLPALITDRAKIVGDNRYIVQAMAHYSKYSWNDDMTDWLSGIVNGSDSDNTWTVTVTPRVFHPGKATFRIKASKDSVVYILRLT